MRAHAIWPLLLLQASCVLVDNPLVGDTGESTSLGDSESTSAAEPLALDCQAIPLTAVGATFAFTPSVSGLVEGAAYSYAAPDLPAGLDIDASTGELRGAASSAGLHEFEVTITQAPGGPSAAADCTLNVRERLAAPVDIETASCLQPGQDLRDLVVEGTGDGSPITCDLPEGDGNGRKPNGIDVDSEGCTLTGAIAEDRYGTWVFMMRGTQSGAEVFVPYCVTNDEPQGYEIVGRHSGSDDAALLPIARVYDPTADFSVGADMDPRWEITAPDSCGVSCFYKWSFLHTDAPIGEGGFSLEPDGFVQDAGGQAIGLFHELRVSGPAVPEELRERPWVLSVAVSYCISGMDTGCEDAAMDGDGALEFGLIMVPE